MTKKEIAEATLEREHVAVKHGLVKARIVNDPLYGDYYFIRYPCDGTSAGMTQYVAEKTLTT